VKWLMNAQFSTHDLRRALGLFTTGVCIATTRHRDERYGITINSFSSVSLEPPLVLFSIARNLRSFNAFWQTNGFAINILSSAQQELSTRFSRAGADKWSNLSVEYGRDGGILIPDALACFDCRKHASYDGGDHVILVGEVTGIVTSADADPLIYYSSCYRRLADPRNCAVA
jgi:Conserved protein/domain typically associated with flavoprotein oxygenases, DIM6/NTAB family